MLAERRSANTQPSRILRDFDSGEPDIHHGNAPIGSEFAVRPEKGPTGT